MSVQDKIIDILCQAIAERKLIKFYYESKDKKGWRTVEPYIVGIKDNGKGNLFLAALPIAEISKSEKQTRHYLLKEINVNKLETLTETFTKPKVSRDKIDHTPTIKVICRFKYPDEMN